MQDFSMGGVCPSTKSLLSSVFLGLLLLYSIVGSTIGELHLNIRFSDTFKQICYGSLTESDTVLPWSWTWSCYFYSV